MHAILRYLPRTLLHFETTAQVHSLELRLADPEQSCGDSGTTINQQVYLLHR